MKTLIVYKSKTGFTERYATWIKEETGYEMVTNKNITSEMLSSYDTVIYGGRVHAGQIDGLKKFKVNLGDKTKLIVFATGATPAEAREQIEAVWKLNLTEEEMTSVPHFYFQSGLNYEKMKLGDWIIMKLLSKMLSSKKDKSSVESGCEQVIASLFDVSDKKIISPLLDCLKVR